MIFKNLLYTIIIVAGFFVITEIVLAVAGVQPLILTEDPLVGFADNIPQFVKGVRKDGTKVYMTPKNKLMLFNYQEFLRNKSDYSYRVFCLGGSTTYGRPYTDKLSFCGWLQAYLKAADPLHLWEVINVGGISYASYRVAHVMAELNNYQPDLFIVYTGQNEFLEQRSYGALQDLPAWVINLDATMNSTRIYSAMKKAADALHPGAGELSLKRDELSGEVDELLNHTLGPESYRRDDELRKQVLLHYRLNLERMVSIAESVDAGIIFVKPVKNLRDMSPFKSEHDGELAVDDLLEWQALYHDAHKLQKAGEYDKALVKYRQALAIDDRFAELHYRIGQVLFARHDYPEAETAFRRAVEEDVAPLRILEPMQQAVADVATAEDIPLVDFQDILRRAYMDEYGHTVFGIEYFTDHVHSNIEGYNMLGMALFNQLVAQGYVNPISSWNAERAESVKQEILAGVDKRELGDSYISLGAVLKWAGKFEEAHAMLLRALDTLGPKEEIYARLAGTSYSLGKLNDAVMYLKKLPPQPDLNVKLAIISLDKGEFDEAISYCQSELDQYPETYLPYNCIAIALAKKGETEQAQTNFNRAMELAPVGTFDNLSYAEFLLGQQKTEEALAYARKSLDINPAQYKAHNLIAGIMLDRGELDQAREHIAEALRLQPDDEDAMKNLQQLRVIADNADVEQKE